MIFQMLMGICTAQFKVPADPDGVNGLYGVKMRAGKFDSLFTGHGRVSAEVLVRDMIRPWARPKRLERDQVCLAHSQGTSSIASKLCCAAAPIK